MINKNSNLVIPIILSGGSGSRLWPLSRSSFPKQFLDLHGSGKGESLFQQTVLRIAAFQKHTCVDDSLNIGPMVIVTNEEQRFLVLDQFIKLMPQKFNLVLEPCGRNTAPALTLAAFHALEVANELGQSPDSDAILVISPADHAIRDQTRLLDSLENCIQEVKDDKAKMTIALIGIQPTAPKTGYGYIECDDKKADTLIYSVSSFSEKPDIKTANKYIDKGNYFWNSGIFVMYASTWLKALKKFRPDIFSGIQDSWDARSIESFREALVLRPCKTTFASIPEESIDRAVIERCPGSNFLVKMVEFDGGWSDLGAWDAVWEIGNQDEMGNVLKGDVISYKSKNSFVYSTSRLVSTVSVDNLIIIETPDVVLVLNKESPQDIKKVICQLEKMGRAEKNYHRKVFRPWGWFDNIEDENYFKVKRIHLKPGASISLQKHQHRAEHWIVIKGVAEITNGNQKMLLQKDQSTYIPKEQVHRLRNPGDEILEIIEVQSGDYLGEDDIIRYEDQYGRVI